MTPRCRLLAFLVAAVAAGADAADPGVELAIETAAVRSLSVEHGKAATGDATPVDPGVLETELGYAPLWTRGAFGAGASTHAWSLTTTYGVMPDVDVKLSGAFGAAYGPGDLAATGPTPQRGSGLGDLVAGARWRLVNLAEHALEIAVAAEAVIPIGARGSPTELPISQGYWSGRLALVGTKDMGRFTTNAEVACAAPLAGDAGGLVALAQVNAAVGYHLTRWLQPELELNYQYQGGLDSHVVGITAGVVVPWGAGHRIVAAVQQSIATWNTAPTIGGVFAYKAAL